MDEPDWYRSWRHEAVHELIDKTARLKSDFDLGRWERWLYDLDAGSLTFSHEGRTGVVAHIQVVGSTSSAASTWLWAWANDSLPPSITIDAIASKLFGEKHSIAELTTEMLADEAIENLAWELTAVTARLTGAKGAYRAPTDNGCLFFVYREIGFAT